MLNNPLKISSYLSPPSPVALQLWAEVDMEIARRENIPTQFVKIQERDF